MAKTDMLVRAQADFRNYDANMAKASRQLDQFKKDNLSLGGVLKQSTSALTGMAAQFMTIGAATKVVKDAFMASESNIDEWGRTVESAKGIYEGFLTSLNTGDISGFLSRIREVINASKDAYDALDRLGTQKAINNAEYQIQNVENERYRAMLRTGRYIAPNDGRSAEMADGTILTKEQKAKIAADLENGLKTINQIVRDEIDQTTDAINKLYTEQAQVLGMSEEEFRKGTASMAEFDKRLQGYAQYVQFNKETEQLLMSLQGAAGLNATDEQLARLNQTNPYSQYKAWGVFKDDGDLFTQINQLIDQRASLQSQNYAQMAQAYRSINTATGVSASGGGPNTTRKGGGSEFAVFGSIGDWEQQAASVREYMKAATSTEEYKELEQELDFIIEKMNELKGVTEVTFTPGSLNDLNQQLRDAQEELANMSPEAEGWADALENVRQKMESVAALQEEISGNGSTEDLGKDIGALVDNVQGAISAFGQLGSAMQGLEDPSAKVAGIIMGAIASVAAGLGQAIASHGGRMENGGPWAWIGFAISATATMISTIAAIKSATAGNYANGGVVGGNSYSGDNLIAHVNSGETILSAAQSDVIANKLTAGNGGGGSMSQPYLTGDVIILGVNNYLGRSGQGEIVTTSMLRRAGIRL